MKYRATEDVSLISTVERQAETGNITDGSARTIGLWYESPGFEDDVFYQLGHGLEFDVRELSERIERAGMYPTEYVAMRNWVDALMDRLAE